MAYSPLAHLPQCTLFAPKILHNVCFSLLLGITAIPREIENSAYAKCWGANKVHYGRYAIGEFREHKAREIMCKQVMVALFLLSVGR